MKDIGMDQARLGRRKIDQGWRFQRGDFDNAALEAFDDSCWQPVNLPHDWSIEGPFSPEHYLEARLVAKHLEGRADSYLPRGTAWYRKPLACATELAHCRIYIEFEGVFRDSTLWVNGHLAGNHSSGYTGVVYDITPWIRCDGKPNILAVKVDARDIEGWWYEGAGIYRHVWLIAAPPMHIAPWGIAVTTPQVNYSLATINVRTQVVNANPEPRQCRLRTIIRDGKGNHIGVMETEGMIAAGKNIEFIQETKVTSPDLWSPQEPNLYSACTEVISSEGEADRHETIFGLRWFEFTPDKGFFLNGQPLQLRGGCIHHDFGGLGTALPDRANFKTVEVLKEMGCNIIRSAHNPAAPSLMDACDRLGMLLWAETRTLNPAHGASERLRSLIRRDRNHPSVIVWSLANTAGSPDGELTRCLQTLNTVAHEEDPSRPTAVALEGNADANANGFAGVTDVVGYNGGGMGIDDRDHRMFPRRRMLISEFSSGRGARGVYQESLPANADLEAFGDGRVMKRGGYYCSIYDLCLSHEKEWRHVAERPWLAGGIMWSVIEYRGETAGWPIVTSQFGVLDICRFPKDAYYFYQKEWTDRPMLHLFPHWTWSGKEGQPIDVWCYSNCDTVNLFLNGKLQPGIPHHLQFKALWPHLYWQVPYTPGILCAEGQVNGQIVCRQEIKTAGTPVSMRLLPDRTNLAADGEDLSFITVSIHDDQGVPAPVANHPVSVEVTGNGRLLGLSSGDPGSHESEKSGCVRAFNGLCLAIVQNTGPAGEIHVTASSPGLTSATVTLQASRSLPTGR